MTKSKDQIRYWQKMLDSIHSICKCFTCIKPSYWKYDIELSEPLLHEKIELVTIEPYGNVKYSCSEIIYMDVDEINHKNGYITLSNSSDQNPHTVFQPPPPNIEYVNFEDNDSSTSNSSGLTSSSDDDELVGYRHTRLYAVYEDKNPIEKYEASF